ncbi:hypothetical protein COLO4_01615, partial [Corchorus olitorius]
MRRFARRPARRRWRPGPRQAQAPGRCVWMERQSAWWWSPAAWLVHGRPAVLPARDQPRALCFLDPSAQQPVVVHGQVGDAVGGVGGRGTAVAEAGAGAFRGQPVAGQAVRALVFAIVAGRRRRLHMENIASCGDVEQGPRALVVSERIHVGREGLVEAFGVVFVAIARNAARHGLEGQLDRARGGAVE